MKGALCYTLFAMIDWTAVGLNALWLLGAAVILAALSYHHWLAQVNGRPLRQQLNTPTFGLSAWLGLILFSLGLAGTSDSWWEVGLWLLLVALAAANALTAWRAHLKQNQNG